MEQVLNTIYTYLAAYGLKIVAALEKLGVRMTSFVVIVGAAGLAIGFALQGSLANFVAGRSL